MCCIKVIWVTALRKSGKRWNGISCAYIAKNSVILSIHFGHRSGFKKTVKLCVIMFFKTLEHIHVHHIKNKPKYRQCFINLSDNYFLSSKKQTETSKLFDWQPIYIARGLWFGEERLSFQQIYNVGEVTTIVRYDETYIVLFYKLM